VQILFNNVPTSIKVNIKIILAFILVIGINLIHNSTVLIPITSIAEAIVLYIVIKKEFRLKSVILILLIATMLALIQTITYGKIIFYRLNILTVTIYFYNEGIARGTLTFLKIVSGTGIIIILFNSISLLEFVAALRRMKIPKAFVEVMIIALKFIYIFREDIFIIRKAQKARLGYRNLRQSVITTGNIGGIVLCRAYDKSIVLQKSMKSRGCDGNNIINE
jgi:cobalt/nickel transport system permease protein